MGLRPRASIAVLVLALGLAAVSLAPLCSATLAAPAVINVRDLGAVGDGKTDDLPALRKAITALQAAGGGSLYFPAGTYLISDRLLFGGDNFRTLHIFGDGDTSVIKTVAPLDNLFLEATQGAEIDHLRFEGPHVFNKQTNQGSAILLFKAADTRIHSCSFWGTGFGVQEAPETHGTVFSDNRVQDWGRVGYFVEGHCQVENNLFEQSDPGPLFSATGSSHAMYIHSGNDEVLVRGNTFRGARYYAIQLYGHSPDTVTQNVTIRGNSFQGNANDILVFGARGLEYQHILISDNTFRDTEGWSVSVLKGTDMEVSDNRFIDVQGGYTLQMGSHDGAGAVRGSRVLRNTLLQTKGGGAGGINVETIITEDIEVRDNWIGMSGRYGIYVHRASRVTLANNVIWMSPGNGTDDFANAIQLDEEARDVRIEDNEIYGTGTRLARGVFDLPNPNLTSGMVAGNRFYGAPLSPGPLQVGDNLIAPLTGKPITHFALQEDRSGMQNSTGSPPVQVVIEGGEDTAAWLLSETQVRLPAPDDPRWQAARPAVFDPSKGDGVKRVLLWRKLADGTVSTRPEVATIDITP
jgi:nitrous oxidase accessory protein NosD